MDCLLDAVQALVSDCDHPAIRKIKNIDAFVNRCKWCSEIYVANVACLLQCCLDAEVSAEIGQWRMKTDDFKLVKVIGRGAFGEVQLVRHKFTKKV